MVAGAGVGGVAGYAASPGEVAVEEIDPEDIEPSDELIDDEVMDKINKEGPNDELA
jgi:hypothetical protein